MFKIRAVKQNNELVIEHISKSYDEVKLKSKEYNEMGLYVFIYNERQIKALDNRNNLSNNIVIRTEGIQYA